MAPFDLTGIAGTFSYALVFGAIGFGFGAVLEATGFGDTRKLAAQFYLRDLTVLKTMFTGIVVAAVLVFGATSLGLLDMSRVWVNPTFLWPGIVGGLVMGVGFVVGGFCPGTSLVAAATGKIDGMVFVAGALVGVGLFGETVGAYEPFFLSGSMGRFTIPDWLGLSTGTVLVLVVAMALFMFWGAELIERRIAGGEPAPSPRRRTLRLAGAGVLALAALLVAARGQPSPDDRFARSPALQQLVAERAILVHPAEVVTLKKDLNLKVDVLDLRPEAAFNLFHVGGARRVDPAALETRAVLRPLQEAGPTTVTFLVGATEDEALAAWRTLRTLGATNLYVVDGGIDRWLDLYPVPACVATRAAAPPAGEPAWRFAYATGESLPSAWPEVPTSHRFRFPCEPVADASHEPAAHGGHGYEWPAHAFTKRVKLQTKSVVKGGCG